MKTFNNGLLSRAEMRSTKGGLTDICNGLTGGALTNCRFQQCMAGWGDTEHKQEETNNKIDGCCAMSGNC